MAVVVSLVCIAAVCAGSTANAVRTIAVLGKPAVIPQEVASLRARVDRRCKLAANGALYVPYLADYTYFTACATPR